MKKLFYLLMLLVVSTTLAQSKLNPDRGFTILLGTSVDLNMAINGPFKGELNDIGTTLNGEIIVGFEQMFDYTNGMRVTHKLEIHPAIDYLKATWLAVDYKLKDHLLWFKAKNFNQYAGLEIATIWRNDPNFNSADPDHYIERVASRLNPGVNTELQYEITDNFAVFSNINVFRAEQILIDDGKNIRWDVMFGVFLKIN